MVSFSAMLWALKLTLSPLIVNGQFLVSNLNRCQQMSVTKGAFQTTFTRNFLNRALITYKVKERHANARVKDLIV